MPSLTTRAVHPHLYVSADAAPGRRSLGELRAALLEGLAARLWHQVLTVADTAIDTLTVITGQLGILAMALGNDHPASDAIQATAIEKLRGYLDIYGPEGEFNDSPIRSTSPSSKPRPRRTIVASKVHFTCRDARD